MKQTEMPQHEGDTMNDEIDLRVYINTLMHHKWLILGLTLISGYC